MIRNKKGIGLPTVLAIVTFLIGTGISLMSITFSQTNLLEKSIDTSEAYSNAVYDVDAAVRVMLRGLLSDPSFLQNPNNLNDIEEYFDVTITQFPGNSSLWQVTSLYSTTKSVSSYLSTASGSALSPEEATNLFAYFSESISNNIKDVPEELLQIYLPAYFETNEIDVTRDPRPSDLDSVKSIAKYVAKRTTFTSISQSLLNQNQIIDGNFYVDGNLTIYSGNTLHIADGKTLFVTGSLTMKSNSNLIGNVIVGNDVEFEGSSKTASLFRGTLYIGTHFKSDTVMTFGTAERPSFVFTQGNSELNENGDGFLYVVSAKFTLDGSSTSTVVNINGGIYTDNLDIKRGTLNITPYDLSAVYEYFETQALPYDGSVSVDGSYTYTTPR